jgi:tetratricopeptide (TPR) repeat protein
VNSSQRTTELRHHPPIDTDEVLALLGAHDPNPRVLEDFCPLHRSLEWVLLRAYYDRAGASAFTAGEVPFAVTSSGRLSEDAAAVLFTSLESAGALGEPIRCLELGPGSGVFAKLLLDDLRRRCREQQRDYYERMTLILADSSRAMLDAIAANGVLSEHEGHYELVHSDPFRPAHAAAGQDGLRAVFLNYVLDSLPASVVRRAETGIEQLCVRICLDRDVALEDYTALSLAEVIKLAGASDEASKQELVDVYPALVVDLRYEALTPGELPEEDSLDAVLPSRADEPAVHSHGALACLRALAECLTPGGFVLFSDFAARERDPEAPEHAPYLIYGGAIAVGINFAQIENAALRWSRCSFHAPVASDEALVSRMIGCELDAATTACFAERFDPTRLRARRAPRDRARKLLEDRRQPNAARTALAHALALAPRDWTLYEEAASFLAYVVKDREPARALARHGLSLNPLSTGLWNVIGDCELHARRPQEALCCYERAIELNPSEVRARYNAAYAFTACRNYGRALQMIADAMALDDGSYRERLLGKQARILDLLARRRQEEQARRRDRARTWRV